MGFKRTPGGKGSHEKWRSTASGRRLIVPRNLKSRHTANGILGDAGSDKRV
ncbi:MAG: type II toxin-antitoxin system HicA family toxin [Gammaproteobacteria bacterium]|nr:type II toxin-antitoxin system HicA family toxin [Gammaproteobacteria bacterium]